MSPRTLQLVNSKSPVMSAQCLTALRIVGDMPTLGIVYILSSNSRRFSELEKLTKINPATLTSRLKQMHAWGLIKRLEQQADNQSVNYSLTDLGNELIPILKQIEIFANQLPESKL